MTPPQTTPSVVVRVTERPSIAERTDDFQAKGKSSIYIYFSPKDIRFASRRRKIIGQALRQRVRTSSRHQLPGDKRERGAERRLPVAGGHVRGQGHRPELHVQRIAHLRQAHRHG